MKLTCISDLHLNNGKLKDDFYMPYLRKEGKLITLIQSCEVMLIGGDFVDLWESSLSEISRRYTVLFQCVKDNLDKIYFIRGNHDKDGLPFATFHDILVLGDCVFMHGHQFDKFNDKWGGIGRAITWLGSKIEQMGWRNVDYVFNAIGRGKYGSNTKYYKWIMRWVDENPEYRNKHIIFGHTHQRVYRVQLDNCMVSNLGTWTGENMDMMVVDI